MKKYIVGLVLLVVQNVCAMELEISPQDDQKCYRVARYLALTAHKADEGEQQKRSDFLNNKNNPYAQNVSKYMKTLHSDMDNAVSFLNAMPDKKFSEFFNSINTLDTGSKHAVVLLSQGNIFVFVSAYQDLFKLMCATLPKSIKDHGGFFNANNHAGIVRIKHDSADVHYNGGYPDNVSQLAASLLTMGKEVRREEMIQAMQDMTLEKVLSVFNYMAEQDRVIVINPRSEAAMVAESTSKVFDKGFFPDSYSDTMVYRFSYDDCVATREEHRKALIDMAIKSNENSESTNIDKRFKFTNEIIELFKPVKEAKCLQNDLFKNASIITDIAPPSMLDKIKDTVLMGAPLLFVVAMPDLIYSKTSGVLQGIGGSVVNGIGCFVFGQHGYPVIDSYNSGVGKLSEWFGVDNHTRIKKGWTFLGLSTMNYVCTAIAQMFTSWGTTPWQIVGGAVHGFRTLASLYIMNSMEKYSNPFSRSNKNNKIFTFGDLFNGPKFKVQ